MARPIARRSLLALLLVAVVAIVAVGYLRIAAIPIRTLGEEWYRTPAPEQCTDMFDAKVEREHRWKILRAQLDHFVAPAYEDRRRIDFGVTCRGGEDPLYLKFWADMHVVVVYCWSQKERKFLWKAVEYHSA